MMTSPRDVTHSAIRTIALVALVVSVTLVIQGRLAPRVAAQAPDDFDDLDNPAVAGVIVGYDVSRLRITTDRASYAIGQAIRFCYSVPAPGQIAILDYQPNGRTTELLGGFDDGRGDCLNGTVTPPAGRECLRIRFFFPGGGSMSRATCFDVLGTGAPPPPPPPPPPPLVGATSQYLRVSVSGGSATLFWQNTPATPREWVSIVKVGTPDAQHEGRWRYTDGQRSGSYMVTGLAPGEYEARLYGSDAPVVLDRLRFRVGDGAAAGGTGPSSATAPSGGTGPSGAAPPAADAGGVTADYRFGDSLASAVGSPPALTNIGAGNSFVTERVDGADRTVLAFPAGGGVSLVPATSAIPGDNSYTVVVLFRFDAIDGFRRILDVKNGTSDRGLYVRGGKLSYYNSAEGSDAPIGANAFVQVALTRTASGGMTGYVNGVQQFTFNDGGGDGAVSAHNTLRFFKDDGSSEQSAGAVARIRIYNRALSADEVARLDRLP